MGKDLSVYIGSKIKHYRALNKMTQEDLAKKLGLAKGTISNYESGYRTPQQNRLFELAEALGISVNDLFPPTTRKVNIQDIYDKLVESRQVRVYNFAEYQLEEQARELNESNVHYLQDYGAVSAGTGELLQEENPIEVEYIGEVPQHDFTVTVNGSSMEPVLQHGERLFITSTTTARTGQIVVASVNGEAFVKKLGEDRLISLNKDYEDIKIDEHDEAKIIGVVVL